MGDDPSDDAREAWRLIYQIGVQNIAFLKRQQWAVTNYALLLYAALIAISQLLPTSANNIERLVFTTIVIALAVAAIWMLWSLHHSITLERHVLDAARTDFPDEVRNRIQELTRGRAHSRPDVSILLTAVLAGGAVIVAWLLVCRL